MATQPCVFYDMHSLDLHTGWVTARNPACVRGVGNMGGGAAKNLSDKPGHG